MWLDELRLPGVGVELWVPADCAQMCVPPEGRETEPSTHFSGVPILEDTFSQSELFKIYLKCTPSVALRGSHKH